MMNPSTVMDATTKMTAETTIMVVVAANTGIIVIFVVVVVVVVVVVDVDFVVEVPSELPDGTSFHFVAVVWGRLLAFLVSRFRRRPTNQPTNQPRTPSSVRPPIQSSACPSTRSTKSRLRLKFDNRAQFAELFNKTDRLTTASYFLRSILEKK